ncbi:MAG TPA: hypothetical protein VJJ47_02355 [Candidatus Paceibacterota bacterium]
MSDRSTVKTAAAAEPRRRIQLRNLESKLPLTKIAKKSLSWKPKFRIGETDVPPVANGAQRR